MEAFIIVAAEYNHGPSAVLKNALDSTYRPFNRKPVALFAHGGVGGARAVEQLRSVCCELHMVSSRFAVHIAGSDFLAIANGRAILQDFPPLATAAAAMLDDLAWWSGALTTARSAAPLRP